MRQYERYADHVADFMPRARANPSPQHLARRCRHVSWISQADNGECKDDRNAEEGGVAVQMRRVRAAREMGLNERHRLSRRVCMRECTRGTFPTALVCGAVHNMPCMREEQQQSGGM